MVVFFATWCPHCRRDAPLISRLEDGNENLRVVMVGIDGRDDPQKVRVFVERYGIGGRRSTSPPWDGPTGPPATRPCTS